MMRRDDEKGPCKHKAKHISNIKVVRIYGERERKLRNGHACITWLEREKEEKNIDACIHAGISHDLACEKYITWCVESFLSIKS